MTAIRVKQQDMQVASSIDDGVCHEAVDDAGLVALCGADISAHPWCDCIQVSGQCRLRQECAVCVDLYREEEEAAGDVDAYLERVRTDDRRQR